MNIKNLEQMLNKKYKFLVEIESVMRTHYRFHIIYSDIIEVYVTYTESGMISEEQNYFFICNKIEKAIIDSLKRR